jgi:chromosome segregation ATPase
MSYPQMTTPELVNSVQQIERQLGENRKERHDLNNQLNNSLLGLNARILHQEERSIQLEDLVKEALQRITEVAASIGRMETALAGDEKYGNVGVVGQVEGAQARISKLDLSVARLKLDVKKAKWTFAILGSLAAILAWLKDTNFIKFLFHP